MAGYRTVRERLVCGSRYGFPFDTDSDPIFQFDADSDPIFQFDADPDTTSYFDKTNRLLIDVTRICDHWPKDSTQINSELLRLYLSLWGSRVSLYASILSLQSS
jgi:hypothetical protein